MLVSYIKVAWRNLVKQPFFSILNVLGLSVGMAGALLLGLYIHDELTYDTMFDDADRIYRINADTRFGGLEERLSQVSEPMGVTLRVDYPQVELAMRFRDAGSILLRKNRGQNNIKELNAAFADSTFFKMFGLELLYGDARTALSEPRTLVLTKSAADKHFEQGQAVGRSIVLNNDQIYTVTGVINDLPCRSFLRNHSVFLAMSGLENAQIGHWGSHNYTTFLKLVSPASVVELNNQLSALMGRYIIPWIQDYYPGMTEEAFETSGNYLRYHLMPLTDIRLRSNRSDEMSPNGSMLTVYILSFIALFLLLLASVNFMNLSTAQSLKRAKEVGVRRALGSHRGSITFQFLTEAGLITFLSLVIAIALASAGLPFFNALSDKAIAIPYLKPGFMGVLLVMTVVLGMLSGAYPALFMSRFIPAKVIKGDLSGTTGSSRIRSALVIFQFTISIFLIVATIVVYQQLKFIQQKELGFSKDQVLVIEDVYGAGSQLQLLKQKVKELSQVKEVTLSSFLPTPSSRSSATFFREGSPDHESAINMEWWRVDFDYIAALELKVLSGRSFNPGMPTDSTCVVLNEAALKALGLDAELAIGTRISTDLGSDEPEYREIIGIVRDFHYASLRYDVEPLCLGIGRFASSMAIKLSQEDVQPSLSEIERLWHELASGQPFNYHFMDDSLAQNYASEQRLGKIFGAFTILSLLIACLGLLGLAAFNAQKRVKEVGIRKVLGASSSQISYRLSMDFLKLVAKAIFIALPLGWLAMDRWLQDFAYRINVPWWSLALAALVAAVIAVLTVSIQSIKAALANPVKSLRTE